MKEFRMLKTLDMQGVEPNGGALSSDYVSKLGSKEVIRHAELVSASQTSEVSKELSKRLRNFTLASKKACHCEDERSEDVAIAKSLNINEITTQSSIARNDNNREGIQNPLSSPLEVEGKCAFTLAEVLITLGIIGVVASLTLPSVITKYQDKVLINKTKKAFAQFQNVLSLASVDNGTPGDNSLTFPKDVSATTVTKNLAQYYKGAQVCFNPNQKGCSKYYYNIMYGVPQYNNNGEAVYQSGSGYKFVTVDGTIFTVSSNRTGCDRTRYTGIKTNNAGETIYNPDGTPQTYDYYSSICANIDVDVNGVKGPNQYGRDVYLFWVYANKLDYNTGIKFGGDSLKNIFSGKDELVYTKY